MPPPNPDRPQAALSSFFSSKSSWRSLLNLRHTVYPNNNFEHPDPLVNPPPSGKHTHTLIVLHGRGDTVTTFAPIFTVASTKDGKTVQECFPGLKLVFPQAKRRRAGGLGRSMINQWFDFIGLHSESGVEERQDVVSEGLRESSQWIQNIIQEEVKLVGVKNVILGGLSQGCATSLHVLLGFQPGEAGARLGGVIGMSGYLPLINDFMDVAFPETMNIDEPFSQSNTVLSDKVLTANFARDIADLPPLTSESLPAFASTPVFIGHGTVDTTVPIALMRLAKEFLVKLGVDTTWKTYHYGHWWKEPEEIDDIVDFLSQKVGLLADDSVSISPANSTPV